MLIVTHDPGGRGELPAHHSYSRRPISLICAGRSPPMILLRLISWPYARKHLLRTLADHGGDRAGRGACSWGCTPRTKACWRRSTRPSTASPGQTQLQISAGEPGFDEDVLEKVQSVAEVRAAAPVIEATVSTDQGNLLILGVDMLGDRSLRTTIWKAPTTAHRRSAGVSGAARFADRDARRSPIERGLKIEQPDSHAHHGGRAGVHRARHHEARRPGERVRRRPGHHGHLRRAEDFRARAQVRPDRYRACRTA